MKLDYDPDDWWWLLIIYGDQGRYLIVDDYLAVQLIPGIGHHGYEPDVRWLDPKLTMVNDGELRTMVSWWWIDDKLPLMMVNCCLTNKIMMMTRSSKQQWIMIKQVM